MARRGLGALTAIALAIPAAATAQSTGILFVDGFETIEPPGLEGALAGHRQARLDVGVEPLAWDPALAASAQAWVDQCVDVEAPIGVIDINPNRSQGFPTTVGENIYATGTPTTGAQAAAAWASEAANYDYASNTCIGGACSHYTQMVWSTTLAVGCGIGDCPAHTFRYVVVCDYAPAGNTGGRPY